MENNQLLPFERNRYYVGKLLTSADFQAEQSYGTHKRRFLNEMVLGSGIICGLGVYSLDDLSVMVDSGVAIDGCGREIVLESPVVRKLSAVDGFEQLQSERATLCLRYREEDVHPVYTVRGQESGERYECNRIREGWSLVLRDSEQVMPLEEPEPEFLASSVLYADETYRVTCVMPAQSAPGASVRMEIRVCRVGEGTDPLTVKAVIQMPAFTDEQGSHELTVELLELCPQESVTVCRYLTAQAAPSPESVLLADAGSIVVRVGQESRSVRENFTLRATVADATIAQIIDQAAASATLEMHNAAGGQCDVPLAEIVLQRTRNAYLMEELRTVGVRRYIRTAAAAAMRQEMEAWFRPAGAAVCAAPSAGSTVAPAVRSPSPLYATGMCEIPLEPGMRRGQVVYSDEIIHGLGPGAVYVTVGAEYFADDPKLGAVARSTIYGNAELFRSEQIPTVPAETAVKVMNDRGSFMVAARLLENSNQVTLPLRWVAVLLPGSGEENMVEKLTGKSIAAVQSTVVLAPRESHFFNVRFNNMEPCTLTYELTEKDSGEITSDGIYTAPGREGVFEIRISCAEMPLISTYAYAVVGKQQDQRQDAGAET